MDHMGKGKAMLQAECRAYLQQGPPPHMDDYVPESLTEIIIALGAEGQPLDDDLREIATIILQESDDLAQITDRAIRQYLQTGAALVGRVLEAQR